MKLFGCTSFLKRNSGPGRRRFIRTDFISLLFATLYFGARYTFVFYVYKNVKCHKYRPMISKNLTAATTRPIILGILKQGSSYGYLIIKKIKQMSGGKMEFSDGMLYPVLHRLEKDGLIESKWSVTDDTRPRKYYEITEAGKQALIEEKEQWLQVNAVLEKLWNVKPSTT